MKKSILHITILFIALSQGICAALEGNEESPDVLIRNKRVIHPNSNAIPARNAVSIARNRGHYCGGAMLSPKIVITAASCAIPDDVYVLSGSRRLSNSVPHRIIFKEIHPQYNPATLANNLALLRVYPDIKLLFNQPVQLFNGLVRSGFVGVLSGWGSTELTGMTYSEASQSIHVEVLTWQDCVARYGNDHEQFTSLEFCTHDPQGYRRSGHNDIGSPLTVQGSLLGILSWARMYPNQVTPDVYTNLALPIYEEWINQFVRMHSH